MSVRLGLVLVLVLRFCAYSYGGVYNRNTAGGELQQERRGGICPFDPHLIYVEYCKRHCVLSRSFMVCVYLHENNFWNRFMYNNTIITINAPFPSNVFWTHMSFTLTSFF